MKTDDPRLLEARDYTRATASAALRDQARDWEVWTCADPEFRNFYDRTVTLIVRRGRARLSFEGGGTADLEPGDTMTIRAGARAVWEITEPIENSYRYHD